jgi:hypothetical protein
MTITLNPAATAIHAGAFSKNDVYKLELVRGEQYPNSGCCVVCVPDSGQTGLRKRAPSADLTSIILESSVVVVCLLLLNSKC